MTLSADNIGDTKHVRDISKVLGYRGQVAQSLHFKMAEAEELFFIHQAFIVMDIVGRKGGRFIVLRCDQYPDDLFITKEENILV